MREKIDQALEKIVISLPGAGGLRGKLTLSLGLRNEIADTILAVLREPTDGMIMAGIMERHETGTPEAWKLATANIYRAMIDAADDTDL